MSGKEKIKSMLKARRKTQKDLAEESGRAIQTIRNKLANDNMAYNYVEEVADMLGFDLVARDRDTGEEV